VTSTYGSRTMLIPLISDGDIRLYVRIVRFEKFNKRDAEHLRYKCPGRQGTMLLKKTKACREDQEQKGLTCLVFKSTTRNLTRAG